MPVKKYRHSISINGRELVYYHIGKGEPLLLIHGITTYSFIWRKVIPFLQDKYEIFAIDLPGCGDSEKSVDEDYSLKNHAQILAQFLKKLHVDKIHLVGHDVGGGICQIMAVTYPQLILSMSLLNTVGYDFWPVQPIISMRTPIIRQLAMATLDIGALRFIVKRGLYNGKALTAELMSYFWRPMKTQAGRKAFLHFAHCLNNRDLTDISEQLKQLSIPVLIIRGAKDVYLSKEIADKLHKNITTSRLITIDTAGHFLQEDEPELIVHHLNAFIHSE